MTFVRFELPVKCGGHAFLRRSSGTKIPCGRQERER